MEAAVGIFGEVARLCMAIVLIGQNAALMFWLVQHPMPEASKDLTLLLVNGSGLLAGTAVNYYLGSSAGSAAKDRALSQQGKP